MPPFPWHQGGSSYHNLMRSSKDIKEDKKNSHIKHLPKGMKFDKFSWQTNAGYGTKKHIEEIKKNGPSLYHRKTFEPIKSLLLKD